MSEIEELERKLAELKAKENSASLEEAHIESTDEDIEILERLADEDEESEKEPEPISEENVLEEKKSTKKKLKIADHTLGNKNYPPAYTSM